MKLMLLVFISYFTSGFSIPTLTGKLLSLRNLRHKRQASLGVCDREETYPCTQMVAGGTPIYGYCSFGPCIIGYRPRLISTICTRRIRQCCVGYTDVRGSCVLVVQTPKCGSQTNPAILSQESGEIASVNYPFNYDNNINCNWQIVIPAGATLNLQVTSLHLENPRSPCFYCNPMCIADRLVIQDRFQSVTHCGLKRNIPVFFSDDRAVTIQFITNSFYAFPGFRLRYTIENRFTTTETIAVITTTPTITTTYIPPTTTTTEYILPITTTTEYVPPITTTTEYIPPITTTTEYVPPITTTTEYIPPITTTTEYVPPITTTTEYVPPITTTTEYIPPITTTTEYVPPITTTTEYVPPITTTTEYVPPTTTTREYIPRTTTPETNPVYSAESTFEASTNSVVYTSPADTTTTTRPYVRISNRTCPGDQTFTETAPYCKERCDNGTITRIDCNPVFESLPQRPGCVCPQDRPVMFGRVCIPRPLCAAFLPPSFACPSGRVPTNCLPTCTLTCENYDTSRERCSRLPSSFACVSGCMCPRSAPIVNREGSCAAIEACSVPPKPKVTTCGLQHYKPNFRIVGGRRALRGSWPWAVQIFKSAGFGPEKRLQCGGTVICQNWILTAAHCFQRDTSFGFDLNPVIYTIHIGKHKRQLDETSNQVIVQNPQQIIPHPAYNSAKTINDIALVRLRQPLSITNTIRPACIPPFVNFNRPNSNSHDLPAGSSCYAVGWGSTKGKGVSNLELKQVRLRIQPRTTCEGFYRNFIGSTSFCVGGVGNDDTCQGDSGGPLLCRHGNRWYVDGITSHGKKCGVPGQPSVYTRVSAFSDWVKRHTGNDCGNPITEFLLTT